MTLSRSAVTGTRGLSGPAEECSAAPGDTVSTLVLPSTLADRWYGITATVRPLPLIPFALAKVWLQSRLAKAAQPAGGGSSVSEAGTPTTGHPHTPDRSQSPVV